MATPSLSYEPATLRLMYDGTMATNAALMSPAPVLRTSYGVPMWQQVTVRFGVHRWENARIQEHTWQWRLAHETARQQSRSCGNPTYRLDRVAPWHGRQDEARAKR